METGFRHQDESELQNAPEQKSTLAAVPVHVIIELANNRLVTAPNGMFFEGERALPGGVESNAIAIARRYGLIGTKAVGPLLLNSEDREHVNGHAFVLEPTLEVAKAANFEEMGLELYDIVELSHRHKQVHEIAKEQDNPELLEQIRRHSALLRAYGRETLRSL